MTEKEKLGLDNDNLFLKENEMLIGFYIQKLKDHVSEFNNAFEVLQNIENPKDNRDVIWDSIEQAAEAVWRITQTIWPTDRRSGSKAEKILTKKRGLELQRLFSLTLGDRKNVNDFRNRLVHYDEDFDDWYLKSKLANPLADKRVVWRGLAFSEHPVHTDENCIVQEYDVDWGVLSAFGRQYSLRAYKKLIETIEDRIPKVNDFIDTVVPERMSIRIA